MSVPDGSVRTRVAPSPTGEPHIGNMYAALFCKAFAKQHQGQFIFRLEDTDRTRYVPGAVQMLHDALHWLGLDPDEGPLIGGPCSPYVQSERLPIYHEYAEKLVQLGAAYYCFCTPERLAQLRAEQEARKEPTRYDRLCLRRPKDEVEALLAASAPHTVRLRVPDNGSVTWDDAVRGTVTFENRVLTDQILLKSDGYPTSHLGIPLDDYLMRVSHVIRGEEWLSSVPYYILLYRAFDWDLPVFAHFSLLRNNDKNRTKMSKRKNPTSVMWYRDQGYLPETFVNFLTLLGWSHPEGKEIYPFEEFTHYLTLERIVKSGPIFDVTKLEWMNGVYIRAMPLEELTTAVQPFLPEPMERDYLLRVLPLLQERMKRLNEIGELTAFFRRDPEPTTLPFAAAIKRRTLAEIHHALAQVTQTLDVVGREVLLGLALSHALPRATPTFEIPISLTSDQFEGTVRTVANQLEWKAGDLFMALRVAITGSNASPPLYESCDALGWPVVFRRLNAAITALERQGSF